MPKLTKPADAAADTVQRALQTGAEPLPPTGSVNGIGQVSDDPPDQLGFATLDDQDDKINIAWYGRDGVGKTNNLAAMANLPDPGKLLLVNAESGMKKLALARRGIDTSRIVLFPDPKNPIPLTYEVLDRLYWKLRHDLDADPDSWLGVGWDSLTEITARVLESVVLSEMDKARRAGKNRDRWFTDRGDYRIMSDQLSNLLRRYRDLPIHFGVVALEEVREQERADGSKAPMWGPMLTPAMSAAIMGYVDIAIRCQSGPVVGPNGPVDVYTGTTKPELDIRAKDRFGVLPRVMPNPTFDRVAAYIRQDLTEATDPQVTEWSELHRSAALISEQAEQEKTAKKSNARAANTRKAG